MRQPLVVVPDLRRLFLAIAHTTLASGALAACTEEPALDRPAAPEEREEGGDPAMGEAPATPGSSAAMDSGSPAPPPADPGTPSSEDAGAPMHDAALPPDADAGAPGREAGVTSAWERVRCPEHTALPDGPLQTPNPISHVSIYKQFNQPTQVPFADGGRPPPTVTPTARAGFVCGDVVTTAAACKEAETLASQLCAQLPCRIAIVTEAGVSSRVETREELLRRFGDIDSAAEVVLLAAFDGHEVCSGGVPQDPLATGAEVRSTPTGFELRVAWQRCGEPLQRVLLSVDPEGKLVVLSKEQLKPANCAIGRRPPGLCSEREGPARTDTGAYLARAAQLEHASIFAFYQLIQELRAHDAPEELRLMALDAMLDEVRHARDVQALARQFGAETVWAQVKQTALRSLLEIAIDNAQEGCVRETFGALLATYQAANAEDGGVQRVMAQIAEDETRHAMLSWKLKAWLSTQLSEREQVEVSEAEHEARTVLAGELELEQPESLRRALGLPSRELAVLLFKRLSRALPS